MKFSKEQFEYLISNKMDFYIEDFNINTADKELMFALFNTLPDNIQGDVVSWGFGDTAVDDNIFEWIIEKCFECTAKEYYDNIFKTFFSKDEYMIRKIEDLSNIKTLIKTNIKECVKDK